MRWWIGVLGAAVGALLLVGSAAPVAAAAADGGFRWKGYDWTARFWDGAPGGPREWSPDNVFVDAAGRLHLRVSRDGAGGLRQAEVRSSRVGWGYGSFRWTVETDVRRFHREHVLGLFTYGEDPGYGHREIDVEASAWGGPDVGWDYTAWGAGHDLVRRSAARAGRSRHELRWSRGRISWRSWDASGRLLASGRTTRAVATPLDERVVMNLWVCGCMADWQTAPAGEVVISDFTFRPAKRARSGIGRTLHGAARASRLRLSAWR